ncbi:MAG TPA: UvrD-helicase domain-containing protein [Kofleriaceae bacterium]
MAKPASLPATDARLVVVEASAGTGKTYFLEHRVVDLVLAGAELGEILLVTFTDKAVAELRLRIRDVLDRLARTTEDTALPGEPAWELDDDARRRLRAAVTAFDHAPIYTIHGFCHRVLIEDAFAAQRLLAQTQVADEIAFTAAFDALLRERFARLRPARDYLGAYLETGGTVDSLRELLLACARADAVPRRRLDEGELRATVAELVTLLGAPDARARVLATLGIKLARSRDAAALRLDAIGDGVASGVELPVTRLLACVDALREPAKVLLEKYVTPQSHAALAGLLRRLTGGTTLADAIAAELLPAILERIRTDKSERGLFDYTDMLALVWQALQGPRATELAERLRTRTPFAMIDEFQDTDSVQWAIFRTVWLHEAARGLTIVGDPKQAIYSFRGADVEAYLAARDELLAAGATRVSLAVNRRSTPELVAAVNQILVGPDLGTPLFDDGAIGYDEPVSAGGDVRAAGGPPVVVLQLQGKAKLTAADRRAPVTAAIGDEIAKLRAAPPVWTSRGAPRPFALGDVMVLTRTNDESAEVAAALRSRGLACALVEPEGLFETREADELAAVLAAIAAPRDRSMRLRALRTRFFDVPWAELMRVVDAPDHHPAIARLFDWAQLASRRAYEALFRRLVEDSRYAERALVLGGGERAVTNTWHLLELLRAEVARSRSDLHELVAQLRRWIADTAVRPDERDVQRVETDTDAIRVLTMHKAKGLEAPFVFLYGGAGPRKTRSVRTLRDAGGRLLVLGKQDEATEAALDSAAGREDQRLAYVALTRAQVRLYLPQYPEVPSSASYYPIHRCLAPWTKGAFAIVAVPVTPEADEPAPIDALAALALPDAPAVAELPALPIAQRGLATLSYTRLAHDPLIAAEEAATDLARALVVEEVQVDDSAGEVGPDELPPGAQGGLLLHDVLEVVEVAAARDATAADWLARPDVAAQFAEAARVRGIAPRYLAHAGALAHRTLVAPFALTDGDSLPALAEAAQLAREVEFAYPIPGEAAGFVRGYIDALAVWDDALWVVDYKSDLLAGDAAAAAKARVDERYRVQARLYALAADRLRGERPLAGILFAFVRHGVAVPVRIGESTLADWSAWLARVAARTVAA